MKSYEKMKMIRQFKGLTQKEIAEKMGTSVQNYSQYETGKRTPTKNALEKIAAALECEPMQIVDDRIGNDFYGNSYPFGSSLSARQRILFDYFLGLTDEGQWKAIQFVELLLKVPEYQNEDYKNIQPGSRLWDRYFPER